MARRIKIFDTTLRDGEQTPGVNLNVKEKVEIAKQLENLKVDIIEAGFPIASNGDFEGVKAIANAVKNSTVAALCRANKNDIDRAWEAIKDAAKPRLHTFIATSDIHLEFKLKMSREEVVARAVEMVKYAKSLCEDIEFSAEDAYRTDKDFLCEIFAKVIEAGATTLNIPDTVGYALPHEFGEFIAYIKKNTKGIENVDISVHCHNDLGMAVANSIEGCRNGATQIECAMNGLGERAGNASLEEVAMICATKETLGLTTGIETTEIYRTSKLVSGFAGIDVQPNKAIVGSNAFAHESGIHQDGVLKNKETYEIMTPESIGIYQESNIVLGKHSGRHAFESVAKELGYELDKETLEQAFVRFKALTDKKKHVGVKDVEAILTSKTLAEETYKLKSFQINSGNNMISTAAIEIKKNDETIITEVAIGAGSIDAAFKAVERALDIDVELADYSIRSVSSGQDALGEVTVKIKSDSGLIIGKAIHEDIMESSILALINAINKKIDQN